MKKTFYAQLLSIQICAETTQLYIQKSITFPERLCIPGYFCEARAIDAAYCLNF